MCGGEAVSIAILGGKANVRYRFSAIRTTISLGWTAVRFVWSVWVAVYWAVLLQLLLMTMMLGGQLLCSNHATLFVDRGKVGRMHGCGGHDG
jgi:hypothetical protein